MSYLDAIEDAASIDDLADELTAAYNKALESVTKQIHEVLTVSVTKAPWQSLSLPFVSYRNAPGGRIAQYTVSEIVADECSTGPVHVALMEVIAGSTCPLVAKLRKVLADAYTSAHAAEYAEFVA